MSFPVLMRRAGPQRLVNAVLRHARRFTPAVVDAPSGAELGARLFTADGHLQAWVSLGGHTLSGKETTVVRLAPTRALLDALPGDLTAVLPSKRVGEQVRANDELVSLLWEGVQMSDADELYHSTFAHATGAHSLRAPLAGTILAFNDLAAFGADAATGAGAGMAPPAADEPPWYVTLQLADPSALLDLVDCEVPCAPLPPPPAAKPMRR